jgi:hypothetical protein
VAAYGDKKVIALSEDRATGHVSSQPAASVTLQTNPTTVLFADSLWVTLGGGDNPGDSVLKFDANNLKVLGCGGY